MKNLLIGWALLGGVAWAAEIPALEFEPFRFELRLNDAGTPEYRVMAGGDEVLAWSALGLKLADADLTQGLSFEKAGEVGESTQSYRLVHGKTSEVEEVAKRRTYRFRGAEEVALEIEARLSEEGVAFRYHLPGPEGREIEVIDEATRFPFAEDSVQVGSLHQIANEWGPGYESDWGVRELKADAPFGYTFPVLIRSGGWYRLFTEGELTREHVGSHVEVVEGGGALKIRFPEAGENPETAPRGPVSKLPWTSPWRVAMLSRDAAGIVESDLITSLAAPSKVEDASWVKPGYCSWSWWSDTPSPGVTESLKRFIDLAADFGWSYSLVDANWDREAVPELVAYAREKGIGLFYWYNSGGDHNVITEKPRDLMLDREVRRKEMAWLRDAGVAGIKVDFFQSDKQARIRQYLDILEDAAEFRLLVNFHGCTMPRGWERTWPHLVTMEAVRGGEVHRFGKQDWLDVEARHNVNLVFTRNVVGPMDYTPGNLSRVAKAGMPQTTVAHQLALGFLFYSGVQHWCDKPEVYRGLEEPVRELLKTAPIRWDETRLIAGEPHRFAVVARRAGDVWVIAGANGEAEERPVAIDWKEFGAGEVKVFGDAEGGDAVRLQESDEVVMAPKGGFVATVKAK